MLILLSTMSGVVFFVIAWLVAKPYYEDQFQKKVQAEVEKLYKESTQISGIRMEDATLIQSNISGNIFHGFSNKPKNIDYSFIYNMIRDRDNPNMKAITRSIISGVISGVFTGLVLYHGFGIGT